MRHTFIGKAAELFQSRRRRKRVQRTVAALSAVVVFVTTYMLILPAITMENQALICGMEEHVHTEDCYQSVLVCEEGQDGQETSGYICGQEEAEGHTHDDSCCGLTCGLEETEGHVHDDSCYESEEVLTCDLEECDGHSHGDSCYNEEGELTCGEDESDGHTHDDSCYTQEEHLVCGQEECEGHTHDDSCYGLICGKEETEGHTHDDSCLPEQPEEETEPAEEHVHTEDCYQTVLVCGMEEHTHTEECYAPASEVNGGAAQPENPGITDTAFPQEIPEGYVEYNFDDEDGLSVTAYAPEDAFGGQEVELVAQRLAEDSEDYAKAQQELDEADDVTYDGFAALDVRFEDGDGKEIEPEGTVYVRFNVQALLPADVDEDTLSVQHHGEETTKLLGIITTGTETYVQTVADSSDSTGDVIAQLAQEPMLTLAAEEPELEEETEPTQQPTVLMDVQAEFAVDSFSTFTITWGITGRKVEVYYVDVNGNQLTGQQKTDIQADEGEALTLADYASSTINGNGYQYAVINDPDNSTKVTAVRYKDRTWQYYADGQWHDWTIPTGMPNPRVYLVYGADKIATVETVDTQGTITMNLFNYDASSKKKGINKDKDFTFRGDSKEGAAQNVDDEDWNKWTGENGGLYQGIVQNKLVNGYPKMRVGSKSSLAYLFNENTVNGKKTYLNVNHLFQRDADGYYYFDSSDNFAQLNTNTKNFKVYNQPINNGTNPGNPKFLPFNRLKESDTTKTKENYDFHFGMTIRTNFIMPKDGKVNGKDMVFEFEGDDDVWVFIDGVLVLDMGGIHDNYSGSINFATGEVKVENIHAGTGTGSNPAKLADLFQAAKKKWDGSSYKSHTFDFFYLERGAGGSNCKLHFNLPTVPKNSLLIGKELTGIEGTTESALQDYLKNMEFKFRVLKNDTKELFLGEGKTYYLVDSETYEPVDNVLHTISADGIIKVKPGQIAVLKDAYSATSEQYQVEELVEENFNGQYGGVQYAVGAEGSHVITAEGNVVVGSQKYFGYKTGALNPAADQNTAVFTNKVDVNKLSMLKITKEVKAGSLIPADTEFEMHVTVDGQPIARDTTYQVNGTTKTVREQGVITLKGGETASLVVMAGSQFTVTESDPTNAYTKAYAAEATYGENQTYDVTVDANSVSGTIQQVNSTVAITVTNADYDFAAQLPLTKTLIGSDGEDHTFQFQFQEADSTGEIKPTGKSWTVDWTDAFTSQQTRDVYFGFKNGTADGTYYYKVSEVRPATADGVSYDRSEYLVEITVENNAVKTIAAKKGEETVTSLDFVNAMTGSLTLEKTVVRTDGVTPDPATEFEFTITVPGAVGARSATYSNAVKSDKVHSGEVTFNDEGVATVKLYHGEQVTIENLPAAAVATITEVTSGGYSVSWREYDTTTSGIPSHTSDLIGKNPVVSCTNTTGAVLPSTGGAGTAHIMSVGAALTLAAGALLLLKRRKEARGAN